ncbi:MAG: putative transposase, partial [Acidimicrobiales bacterium]
MLSWCWDADDLPARRLAMVGLVATGAASRVEVAAGFGVSTESARRWSRAYESGGAEALGVGVMGPKGPSKLTEEKRSEIRSIRAGGASMAQVAERVGVSLNSVSRSLRGDDPLVAKPETTGANNEEAEEKELVPLTRPLPRDPERQAARAGLVSGAAPVFCEGASLPLVGALVILPSLLAGGLMEAMTKVYGITRRACFYSLSSMVLTVVFSALVGEPRAEGLSRVDPVALGRLLGLDRAPEVGTWRRRMEELAGLKRSEELVAAMAAAHLAACDDLPGIFHLDGHVRAYHGRSRLPKAHLARARLAMPGTTDTWVTDARGDGVMVWTGPPGATLSAELSRAMTEIRALLGEGARPTLVFDRGGWSPKVFAEVIAAGFHILTYRKGKTRPAPTSAFEAHDHIDDLGHPHHYLLAERNVRLSYKKDKANHYVTMRQVTRADPGSGHQTQVL